MYWVYIGNIILYVSAAIDDRFSTKSTLRGGSTHSAADNR